MSKKIHHATVKKARNLGMNIEMIENEAVVSLNSKVLASHPSASVALEQAIELMETLPLEESAPPKAKRTPRVARPAPANEAEEEAEEAGEEAAGDEDDEEEAGRSVIRATYKNRYKPHGNTCGDEISALCAEHLKEVTEDGDVRIDAVKLKKLAVLNDCWQDKYQHLNVGMQRMNIVNRLRAKVRKGHEIRWPTN